MKILHLVHRSWPYHGGAERYVMEHALAGNRRGHESTVCTTNAWDMSWFVSRRGMHLYREEDVYSGVRILRFPVIHPPGQGILRGLFRRMLKCGEDRFYYPNPFIPGLQRWLSRDHGFDLVHSNAMPFLLYQGWRYSRRYGSALVTVPHASLGERYRRSPPMDYFSGCLQRILTTSSFVVAQNSMEAGVYSGMGVPDSRIHLSGGGIDPEEFNGADAGSARERYGLRGPVVLCMTAHSMDRGFGDILKACRELQGKGEEFTLVLAGQLQPDAEEFLDAFDFPGEKDGGKVVTTGYVRRDLRLDLVAAADLLILPSRLDCFGIVILEAWMLGKPVIGSWSGAMPDIITDGRDGFLVSWGDSVTLSHRIRLLLHDRSLSRSMGERGRSKVLENWTWSRITDRFYRRAAMLSLPGSHYG